MTVSTIIMTRKRGSSPDRDTTEALYVGVVIVATVVFTGAIRYVPTTIASIVMIRPVMIFTSIQLQKTSVRMIP